MEKGEDMKTIKEAKEKTGKDLYTDKYEFRACGGSIEPEERKEKDASGDAQDQGQAQEKA